MLTKYWVIVIALSTISAFAAEDDSIKLVRYSRNLNLEAVVKHSVGGISTSDYLFKNDGGNLQIFSDKEAAPIYVLSEVSAIFKRPNSEKVYVLSKGSLYYMSHNISGIEGRAVWTPTLLDAPYLKKFDKKTPDTVEGRLKDIAVIDGEVYVIFKSNVDRLLRLDFEQQELVETNLFSGIEKRISQIHFFPHLGFGQDIIVYVLFTDGKRERIPFSFLIARAMDKGRSLKIFKSNSCVAHLLRVFDFYGGKANVSYLRNYPLHHRAPNSR